MAIFSQYLLQKFDLKVVILESEKIDYALTENLLRI